MPDIILENGQTFGCEIESQTILPGNVHSISHYGLEVHDASVETMVLQTSFGLYFDISTPIRFPYNRQVIGTEFVTKIFRSDRAWEVFLNVLKELENAGDTVPAPRCSTHFHFTLTKPDLRTLQNVIRLAGYFEPLFFHLGGLGFPFRGEENDFNYCRPVTTSIGPPIIKGVHGKHLPVFYFPDLLEATSVNQFFERYGDCIRLARQYHPVRYCWINLYNLMPNGRGTLEFRVWNRTLNPYFMYSAFRISQWFTQLAMSSYMLQKRVNEENSLFSWKGNTNNLLDIFINLCIEKGIIDTDDETDVKTISILYKILEKTPMPKINNYPVFSHLIVSNRFTSTLWTDTEYEPNVKLQPVKSPNYIDIHTLGY